MGAFGAVVPGAGTQTNAPALTPGFTGFSPSPEYKERTAWLRLDRGVRVCLNAPMTDARRGHKHWLVFYALPNGNTIEQTIGKVLKPGDDWHFNIQHIGAQTRFLRAVLPEQTLVVAYLENSLKSWPAWRKQFGDDAIPPILKAVEECVPGTASEIVLSGHSGGGSLIFGYLNTVERIPPRVMRIALLDANYAYDTARHEAKLATWLEEGQRHCLCVLAYDDAAALLEGKTFVSPTGGTWGRSHQMHLDLSRHFQFTCVTNAGFRRFSALDRRLQFILKENPDQKIFHTVQVEKNGLIHSLLCGTAWENRGYEYFGEAAYTRFIQAE